MTGTIILGTSFSPEYAKHIAKTNSVDPLQLLKIVHTDLSIKEFRLGLRWNAVNPKTDRIDLEYYRPYLDFMFKNGCTMCLNVGPIKVFRWPEEHIPKHLREHRIAVVTEHCQLALYSYEFLQSLLRLLEKEYGDYISKVMFQLENEPFYRFGHFKMLMSEQYVKHLAIILKDTLPSACLMVNSAGRRNSRTIVKLFNGLITEKVYPGGDLTLGFNYYFKLPCISKLKIDPISISNPLHMGMHRLQHEQQILGFKLEVTEGQFEPWGPARSPGNSYEDFAYLMKNCLRYFPSGYEKKLIRLWGTEELALKMHNGTLTNDHKQIISAIQQKSRD